MTIDRKTKIKIARYYYSENYTQTKIADLLSIPRQTVNKIVQNLVADGIVRFEIIDDQNYFTEIETELEKKFGLKQAIVIDYSDPNEMSSLLGQKGAEYLLDILKPGISIGLSWGNTLGALANRLPPRKIKDAKVVQLVGGSNYLRNSMKADEITRITAAKLNGESYLLYAPSHVNNIETKKMMLNEKNIQTVFSEIKRCDVAVIGIGSLSRQATLFQENYLSENEYKELMKEDCVGDICSRYFNSEGKIVNHKINDIVIGVEVEDLLNIPLVIGVAGGDYKKASIAGALKGGFLDVLITTKDVAEQLVE